MLSVYRLSSFSKLTGLLLNFAEESDIVVLCRVCVNRIVIYLKGWIWKTAF